MASTTRDGQARTKSWAKNSSWVSHLRNWGPNLGSLSTSFLRAFAGIGSEIGKLRLQPELWCWYCKPWFNLHINNGPWLFIPAASSLFHVFFSEEICIRPNWICIHNWHLYLAFPLNLKKKKCVNKLQKSQEILQYSLRHSFQYNFQDLSSIV